MSDHWEEIGWDKEDLIHANVNLTWYLNGQVARLEFFVNHRNKHRVTKSSTFLVPMHGGIWIMCVSLPGTSCRGFYNVVLRRNTHISFVRASGFKYNTLSTIVNAEHPNVFSLFRGVFKFINYHYGYFQF